MSSHPRSKAIYVGPFIHSRSLQNLEICADGAIGVDESGTIAFVERDSSSIKAALTRDDWIDAPRVRVQGKGFFFPGFIDTHIHASQYPNTGIFGSSTLLDWLTTYTFPLEASLSDLSKAALVYDRVIRRTLSHGTTTAAYYATVDVDATNLLASLCHRHGQRAFIGRVCMDENSPEYYRDESAEEALRKTEACIAYTQKLKAREDDEEELVQPIITPRFAPACSRSCMKMLGELHARTGLLCQTHIAENKGEIAWVKELFPECASYADVYDAAGLLTGRTVLAHAIYLTEAERALVKRKGAGISHCPASNTALSSGCARVRGWLDEGVNVGLGTDVSGGYSPSMLESVRQAILVSRTVAMRHDREKGGSDGDGAKLSVEEALYLATRGGAKVLGLEDKIGGFEVGKAFDAQLIQIGHSAGLAGNQIENEEDRRIAQEDGMNPLDYFGWESWEDIVAKWVYCGDDRNCVAVWVSGRLVHKSRQLQAQR